jgi:hypothetical protein
MALDQHSLLLKMVVMVSPHYLTGRSCWSWLSWFIGVSTRKWERAPQRLSGNRLYPLGFAHHVFIFLVLFILYKEGIVGGIRGGHYRLYLLCAGGRLVAMDEACVARMRSGAEKRGASPDANVNIVSSYQKLRYGAS